MNGNKISPLVRVFLVVAVLGAATGVTALILKYLDEPDLMVPVSWAAPTDGTAVVSYVVEVEVNGRDIETLDPVSTEEFMLPIKYGQKYRVRVAGVDAQNVQGPFSSWSAPYGTEITDPPPAALLGQ
jgi:hypothetical protein